MRSLCLQNAFVYEAHKIEKRNIFIVNGKITQDRVVDQTWDLSQWLIMPGLVHKMYLSHKELGLEMIFKAVRKGATRLQVNDLQYWKHEILNSDYPDLAAVLHDQPLKDVDACIINPWISVKQMVNACFQQGMDLETATSNALECKLEKKVEGDADLIFIQLGDIKSFDKVSDVLFPMLFLENEDGYIKAVMKKGEFIYSKYGCSLDSPKSLFEDPFYPQISQVIDAKFDEIEKAVHDLGIEYFFLMV